MKRISVLSIALLALFPLIALATPVEKYNGTFTIESKHETPLNGLIHLFFEDDAFSLVKINTEKPIMKQTEFDSNEQRLVVVENAGTIAQLSVAYKLKKPLHKNWYFVTVTNPTTNTGEFSGAIFKALDSLDNIETLLKGGIDLTAPVPAEWKLLGTVVLTKVIPTE